MVAPLKKKELPCCFEGEVVSGREGEERKWMGVQ